MFEIATSVVTVLNPPFSCNCHGKASQYATCRFPKGTVYLLDGHGWSPNEAHPSPKELSALFPDSWTPSGLGLLSLDRRGHDRNLKHHVLFNTLFSQNLQYKTYKDGPIHIRASSLRSNKRPNQWVVCCSTVVIEIAKCMDMWLKAIGRQFSREWVSFIWRSSMIV